jgi:hypothetical protein
MNTEDLGVCDEVKDPHPRFQTCQNWHAETEEEKKVRELHKNPYGHTNPWSAQSENPHALTTKNNVEIGKHLLSKAQNKYNQDREDLVVKEVERIMRAKDEYRTKLEHAEKAIVFYDRKLSALDAGEFEIDITHGYQGGIKFDDEELNKPNY